ncbi:MAG: DNA repair protein RecO [Clostridia bacterium]|nr:DNA repair protein RecO [Clostridia bacterium]
MEEKLSGILLYGVPYGDNDKIISIFTLEQGLISAKIKGVKKAGAKLKFAAEPFCFAEYIFSKTANKRTVIGASLIDSFYPVRESVIKLYSASLAVEFVRKFFKEGMESKETFVLLADTLKSLAYSDFSPKCAVARFLIYALNYSGYALNLSGCALCNEKIKARTFFNPDTGSFYCEECFDGRGREVDGKTLTALEKIEKGENLLDEECVRPLKLLNYYINYKTDETLSLLKTLLEL